MAVRTTHARRAHRQTGTTSVAVRVAQTPLAGRDNHVTEAAVMGSMAAAQAQAQATASTTTRAAELMVYGKTLLATRTLQAMGRGGWRRISRVNVVEFKRDAAPILLRCLSLCLTGSGLKQQQLSCCCCCRPRDFVVSSKGGNYGGTSTASAE